ncbi:MAG TPA: M1 family aminopeptidase, partial [Bacteroidota bacterium]|nr:M1 family aminopeptidase [Bacteroidota bacterium]
MVISFHDPRAGEFRLRLHPAYVVGSVTIGGEPATYESSGGYLVVRPEKSDTLATVVVEYAGRIDFRSEFTRVTPERAVLREEEVLPWGTRGLGRGRLRVTVPGDWTVVTVGDVEGVTGTGATREWTFGWNLPVPAVGWICAGRYRPPATLSGSTGISLYVFPEDSADTDSLLRLIDGIMTAYGSEFSPYRYGSLTVVEVDDWVAGGGILAIAAPSFVMVKQQAFRTDDGYNRIETILPHEIAHQWWMGTVFAGDRDAAFLSEGLCEYSSILFGELSGRAGTRDTLINHPLLRPLLSKTARGAAFPLDSASDIRLNPTRYLKASYVHHMLRDLIGKDCSGQLLREFIRRYSGRYATIPDFRSLAGEVSGMDLGWFFDQWVSGSGIPSFRVYNVGAVSTARGWRVRGRLRIQGYDRFTARVEIALKTGDGESRTVVDIGRDTAGGYRNDVPFEFETNSRPLSVRVDPDGDLLKMEKLPEKFSDLREPGSALMVTGSGPGGRHGRVLAGRDSARLAREGWAVDVRPDTGVTLGDLQRDRVILYGNAADNRAIANLTVRLPPFPMSASGDSITLDGETIHDSTLSLLQVVENPYFGGGLLVWVLPFSDAAYPELRPF